MGFQYAYLSLFAATLRSVPNTMILKAGHRSIIFICHSLGGIVVKEVRDVKLLFKKTCPTDATLWKALVRASSKELHADIKKSTIGVMFMGTPHRGSHAATLGSIVANVAKSLLLDISTRHLEELVPGSRELQKLTADFLTDMMEPQIEVVSFFETSKLKLGISGILVSERSPIGSIMADELQVVPPASAILDPEATDHQAIPLHGNHRQICQFPTKEDSQYRLVKGTRPGDLESPGSCCELAPRSL
jgi:hypothetical protein